MRIILIAHFSLYSYSISCVNIFSVTITWLQNSQVDISDWISIWYRLAPSFVEWRLKCQDCDRIESSGLWPWQSSKVLVYTQTVHVIVSFTDVPMWSSVRVHNFFLPFWNIFSFNWLLSTPPFYLSTLFPLNSLPISSSSWMLFIDELELLEYVSVKLCVLTQYPQLTRSYKK